MSLSDKQAPSSEQYEADKKKFNNWGRWGKDDQLGTLNLITPEVRKNASSLVQNGISISCSYPLDTTPSPRNPNPAQHFVSFGPSNSHDYIGVSYHGLTNTHIDALCHNFVGPNGPMYNDFDSSLVTSNGAEALGVQNMKEGIFTRGVLYDVPAFRGTSYVDHENPVHGWELEEIAKTNGIEPKSGDAVLIRSGIKNFLNDNPAFNKMGVDMPGVHASCIEFFHKYDAAILGWDMMDASNQGYQGTIPIGPDKFASWPVHFMALPFLGMPLIDNTNLDPLAEYAKKEERHEFLFVISPLNIQGGTGSPVNPLAIF